MTCSHAFNLVGSYPGLLRRYDAADVVLIAVCRRCGLTTKVATDECIIPVLATCIDGLARRMEYLNTTEAAKLHGAARYPKPATP